MHNFSEQRRNPQRYDMMHEDDAIPLELPKSEKTAKSRGFLYFLLILFIIAACAGAYGLRWLTALHTQSAVVEGELRTLSAQFGGLAVEVPVRKGQHVQAGQVLIRFEPAAGDAYSAEAGAQAAALRRMMPPPVTMENTAERAAGAQAAEQDIASRISQARAQEDAAVREVQHRAEEHAKAQLELRRLDLLSSRYSVPAAQHDKARNDELAARRNLERARAAREESSRARAAVEGELNRVKAELAEARSAAVRQRTDYNYAQVVQAHPAASRPAGAQADPYTLIAPSAGVIADLYAQEGEPVQAGKQLVDLVPEQGAYSVMAWFPEKEASGLKPGNECRIYVLELPAQSFSGRVEAVLPAGSVAPKILLSGVAPERHVPVRVRFLGELPPELKPGMRAAVRVYTIHLPWESLLHGVEGVGAPKSANRSL